MSTDILFIHPGNQKRTYQQLANEFTAIATPSWTSLLAGSCLEKGKTVAIYDVNIDGWDEKLPAEITEKYNPELVVIMVYGHNPSASTQTMPAAGRIAADIREFNADIPVAMGGIHPSALPEKTLEDEKIDFVIQGEGTHTIPELSDYLMGKRGISNVRGLWHKRNAKPEFTGPSPTVENLDDELPGYHWELLPGLERYRAHNMHCFQDFKKSVKEDFSDVRSPYVAMNTSLGCPFKCNYCCINAIFDKPKIRYWSLEKVMGWFDELAEKGVRNIRLDDELFVLSPQRVERFCDMLTERKHDFNIWVYGRVDTVRDSLLSKLKQAGISWICLGIESGNEKVRNHVNKKIGKDIGDVVRTIQGHGIYVLGNYMFGFPEDNFETMRQTLDLAIDLNCEFANFYTVMAIPGSDLYSTAIANGHVFENWQEFSQHSYETRPLPTKHLSSAQVLEFREKAFETYFKNSAYLDSVEEKFGFKTRRHIEKMNTVKIKRKILGN